MTKEEKKIFDTLPEGSLGMRQAIFLKEVSKLHKKQMTKPKKVCKEVKKRNLTSAELLELIVDVAYEQATRECSGTNWYNDLCKRIMSKFDPSAERK